MFDFKPALSSLSIAVITLMMLILCGFEAIAQDEQDENIPHESSWGIGLGLIAERSPIRDVGAEYNVLPFLAYESKRFFFRGTFLGYHLIQMSEINLTLQASYRFAGFDSGDSAFLHGMEDREDTVEGGLALNYETSYGEIGLTVMTDLLNRHQGQQVDLSFSKGFGFRRWFFEPFVEVSWQSSKLADYYYGVRETEATPIRPAYQTDATINLGVGLDINYFFTQNAMLRMGFEIEHLDNNIADSPIVEYDWEPGLFIGYIYHF